MGIVDQTVEDAIGKRWVADLFMPTRYRQLRSEDGRMQLVTVLADLPEIAALWFRQRGHCPVVDHENIDTAEPGQQTAQAAVCPRHREITKQRLGTSVERRVPIAAC